MPVATGVKMEALQLLEAMNFDPLRTASRNTTMVEALAQASETMNPSGSVKDGGRRGGVSLGSGSPKKTLGRTVYVLTTRDPP
eukprot:4016445-Pleurochrysis_carterae.AAC.1